MVGVAGVARVFDSRPRVSPGPRMDVDVALDVGEAGAQTIEDK